MRPFGLGEEEGELVVGMDPLRAQLRLLVQECVHDRDVDASLRAGCGEEPGEIVVCLGPGRCMFPTMGSEARECAFCARYPSGRNTSGDDVVDRFVARVRLGH